MPLTAADIRAVLRRAFPPPEHAIVFEVAQATGFDARRHLDAVVMDLWPSRGLQLHGIEIKVSLHDWRREKANPEKAEQIARFCDVFSVAAPKGLIPCNELPPAWGLIEIENSDQLPVRQAKAPEKTAAEPIGRPFLAAMLRAATRPLDPESTEAMLQARRKALDDDFEARVKQEAERLSARRSDAAKSWEELVAALGDDPRDYLSAPGVATAVKAVMKSNVAANSYWGGLWGLWRDLTDMAERIEAAAAQLGVERPPDPLGKTRKRRKKS